jgi:hypothetical protein
VQGAFKKHVLYAMSEPGTCPSFLMNASGFDPDLNANQRMLVIFTHDYFQTIL